MSSHPMQTSPVSNTSAPQDTEHRLTFGSQSAIVSPFGASLRRYFVTSALDEWDVIWGYTGGAQKQGGQGDVLAPFPGRVKNGEFTFGGEVHSLAKNDKDGPNAIHGFLRAELFQTIELTSTTAVFRYDLLANDYAAKGFPFSLQIEVSYSVSRLGLTTSYRIKNTGAVTAPAGIGFHPYFQVDKGPLSDWSVEIPAQNYLELENLIPTGRVLPVDGTKLDFKQPRFIKNERYNDCLAHLERSADGSSQIRLGSKNSTNLITLKLDKSFDYVVIYTGDQIAAPNQRLGLAVEPMTCAPDAYNHADWGAVNLSPGSEMTGAYTIHAGVIS